MLSAIDTGRWVDAARAAEALVPRYDAAGDPLWSLSARLGVASVAMLDRQPGAEAKVREVLALAGKTGGQVDAVFPAFIPEMRLFLGLLAGYRDDQAGVAQALRSTEGSPILRDYPTVAQLHQVVLAEQERLSGKPQLAVARLVPLVRHDTALVAVHWGLMRAARAAGNPALANAQQLWLATHRGRVFTEATSSNVLSFFNVAVSGEAIRDRARASGQATRAR